MSQFSLLKGYIYHYLYAVNRHSLHAPEVFNFYTQVIQNDHILADHAKIESFRNQFLRDQSLIKVNSPGAPSRVSRKAERQVKSVAKHSLSSPKFSRLLYRLVSLRKPKIIIELGTSLGITSLYLSAAYPEAKVITFEGCAATVQIARNLFSQWNIKNIELIEGNIDQTLPKILNHYSKIDLAYMDANHQYEPTFHYYKLLSAKKHQDTIFIVDDIYWSSGMQKAWKALCQKQEVSLSLDLFDAGILFFKPLLNKQHYLLSF